MNFDLQRASLLKRVSAYLLDMMVLACVISLMVLALSAITGYDSYTEQLEQIYQDYETRYEIDTDMTQSEYDAMSEEEQAAYDARTEAANAELATDEEAQRVYTIVVNLTLVVATVSVLVAMLLTEFAVPMLLKNGQTVGKKVFGIAIMRVDGVKITPFVLMVRTLIGKYTIETMIPVLIVIMALFGSGFGTLGTILAGLILLAQVILPFATREHSALHDKIACTVAVDMASQRIFDSPEARMEYMKRVSAENAAKAEY